MASSQEGRDKVQHVEHESLHGEREMMRRTRSSLHLYKCSCACYGVPSDTFYALFASLPPGLGVPRHHHLARPTSLMLSVLLLLLLLSSLGDVSAIPRSSVSPMLLLTRIWKFGARLETLDASCLLTWPFRLRRSCALEDIEVRRRRNRARARANVPRASTGCEKRHQLDQPKSDAFTT
ncbi:hypothetical protein MPTK1_6g13040 [Marchantia polymorpha subsp. ruderalis]|uniref:Transmembrane protein n=2 Tax=Marchantia polymorpha TaxID=3197 RepID=A0AAF6BRJ1_MARPO|nr:hypothetical protein MARPO_0059s0045 [Marchantia polymorpha]BBN14625.1 hypothetical protein Mp_6g13040 [Marchantia polymorpha subsp. ruderalis]|eukprot:PTQ37097.1 hypothetical protein MARPO_0059s0045 [Marchantia polymorpha]